MVATPAPRMETRIEAAPVRPAAPAPVEAPRAETVMARPELPAEAPMMAKNTDYAVKNEISFDFESEKAQVTTNAVSSDNKPKINWAEKLQNAASKYESQKNFEGNTNAAAPAQKVQMQQAEARNDYAHFDNAEGNGATVTNQAAQNRESRIKSIAEKLGFFNFDEDEFDTPSFMKKERNHDSQI